MKIVVLDGYTLNPGDLSWERLQALGACTIYDRTPSALTVERARDADVVFTNKTVLDCAVLAQLPSLRYIGVLATGYNVVDTAAASGRGIVVTNVPAYGTEAVAQMVFAHLLNLAQHVAHHAQTVRDGRWSESEDFCYWDTPLVELRGLTMGLIGLGRIGQAVARIAGAFGMRVIGCDPAAGDVDGVGRCRTVDEVVSQADVVSLHCPLTDDTRHIINAERLALMKPTAFLVNTSRGPLVDGPALVAALEKGTIAGAGLDVLATEPPPADEPLLTARNCAITPHIAWATRAARSRLLHAAVDNLAAFLDGSPVNRVG
jgi:glycerate dehydrogenase